MNTSTCDDLSRFYIYIYIRLAVAQNFQTRREGVKGHEGESRLIISELHVDIQPTLLAKGKAYEITMLSVRYPPPLIASEVIYTFL
jgi:hypothetical protein